MAGMTYYEQLRHPRWQRKRLEVLNRDCWKCQECGTDVSELQVHHGYYAKGKMAWEHPDETLHSLCDNCHEIAEAMLAEIREGIGALKFSDLQKLIDWLKTGERPADRETPLPPLPKTDAQLIAEAEANLRRARNEQGITT